MTTPTPSPEVRKLAARTIHDRECRFRPDHHEMAGWCNDYADLADAVLAAVSPVIRRQERVETLQKASETLRTMAQRAREKRTEGATIAAVGLSLGALKLTEMWDAAAAIARTHAHPEEGK